MNKETRKAMFSSHTDDWETPQGFFDALNAEFGFELDAAANSRNHKCEAYYTREDDGLLKPWRGFVWCNPPYGREIGKWVGQLKERTVKRDGKMITETVLCNQKYYPTLSAACGGAPEASKRKLVQENEMGCTELVQRLTAMHEEWMRMIREAVKDDETNIV